MSPTRRGRTIHGREGPTRGTSAQPRKATGILDNGGRDLASSGRENDSALVVRPTVRLVGGDAGHALAAAQGAMLRRLLASLELTEAGKEPMA